MAETDYTKYEGMVFIQSTQWENFYEGKLKSEIKLMVILFTNENHYCTGPGCSKEG